MDVLDVLRGDIHQEKVISQTTNYDCVMCPGMPSHVQICLDLTWVLLVSLGGIAKLKVIQNEK